MKVQYKAGPCKHKQCCPRGDTHGSGAVELKSNHRLERGGDPVEMPDDIGAKLIADHPGMFSEVKAEKPAAPQLEKAKK